MAVIVTTMGKPKQCAFCLFAERINNGQVICEWYQTEMPINDCEEVPGYCPIKEVKDN